jgi:hypothetical protein
MEGGLSVVILSNWREKKRKKGRKEGRRTRERQRKERRTERGQNSKDRERNTTGR